MIFLFYYIKHTEHISHSIRKQLKLYDYHYSPVKQYIEQEYILKMDDTSLF